MPRNRVLIAEFASLAACQHLAGYAGNSIWSGVSFVRPWTARVLPAVDESLAGKDAVGLRDDIALHAVDVGEATLFCAAFPPTR